MRYSPRVAKPQSAYVRWVPRIETLTPWCQAVFVKPNQLTPHHLLPSGMICFHPLHVSALSCADKRVTKISASYTRLPLNLAFILVRLIHSRRASLSRAELKIFCRMKWQHSFLRVYISTCLALCASLPLNHREINQGAIIKINQEAAWLNNSFSLALTQRECELLIVNLMLHGRTAEALQRVSSTCGISVVYCSLAAFSIVVTSFLKSVAPAHIYF